MALSFDHAAKRIGVPQAEAAPLMLQDLINASRDEEASERGITYDQIADASGKADLGGSVFTGITVALRSTWLLEFASGAYQAAVDGGNLADGLGRIYNTGSPQVVLRSSAAATLVMAGGVSVPTAEQNAAAVLAAAQSAPIHAEVKRVNGVLLGGTGVLGDPWGPA